MQRQTLPKRCRSQEKKDFKMVKKVAEERPMPKRAKTNAEKFVEGRRRAIAQGKQDRKNYLKGKYK